MTATADPSADPGLAASRRQAAQRGAAVQNASIRTITTPDGVQLRVELASRWARIGAMLLDLLTIVLTLLLGFLLIFFIGGAGLVSFQLFLLLLFLMRVFYFPYFEMVWRGQTPGKYVSGIRVIDRAGGGLTGEAVLVRNLVREVEYWTPILLVASGAYLQSPGWAFLTLFICLIALLPVFNRDRLRGGDILAGTWVVVEVKPRLPTDLARSSAVAAATRDEGGFTADQLATYGVKELEVLADVLRHDGPSIAESRAKVAKTIQAKIGYEPRAGESDLMFLRRYYAALRGDLERRKVQTGYAPADKHAKKRGGA